MERMLLFSADCHASPLPRDYYPYLEARFHDDLKIEIAEQEIDLEAITSKWPNPDTPELKAAREESEARYECATHLELRRAAAEIDGFVGEIIFPDNSAGNRIPFSGRWICGVGPKKYQPVLWLAGLEAYNRWLGEHAEPERQLGVGMLAFHDPQYALSQVKRFRALGLRGVMPQWDPMDPAFPPIYDEAFDPVWAACAADELPVTFHPHAGRPVSYYRGVDQPLPEEIDIEATKGSMIYQIEDLFWSRRSLWHLIIGGVLERHPNLQAGFVEMWADWIPQTLRRLDYLMSRHRRTDHVVGTQAVRFVGDRKALGQPVQWDAVAPGLASEYWQKQCFVGAHSMSVEELQLRDAIGVDNFTYGTDFPHANSPWKHNREYLLATVGVAGVPENEARQILGENIVRIYNLDREKLVAAAERIGPFPSEILDIPEGKDVNEPLSSYERYVSHHIPTSIA